MDFKNFFKKLFSHGDSKNLVEETRVINGGTIESIEKEVDDFNFDDISTGNKLELNSEDSLIWVKVKLIELVADGELKDYSNIKKFIGNVTKADLKSDATMSTVVLTNSEELQKFAKKWVLLSYKCENKIFDKLIKSMAN